MFEIGLDQHQGFTGFAVHDGVGAGEDFAVSDEGITEQAGVNSTRLDGGAFVDHFQAGRTQSRTYLAECMWEGSVPPISSLEGGFGSKAATQKREGNGNPWLRLID